MLCKLLCVGMARCRWAKVCFEELTAWQVRVGMVAPGITCICTTKVIVSVAVTLCSKTKGTSASVRTRWEQIYCIHIECGIGRGIDWHIFCKPSNKWPVRKLKVMVSRTIKSCLECGNKDSPVA